MNASSLFTGFALILSLGLLPTVEAGLPEESQQLLEKLKEFEVEQSKTLAAAVMDQRTAVSEDFKAMAVSETKRGNLEGANLINHFQLMLCDSSKDLSEIVESDLDPPGNVSLPLERLAEFERRERGKKQTVLENKRKAVIRVLDSHLQQALREGDLDAANALKKAIEIVGKGSPNDTGNPGSVQIPDDAVSFNGRHYKIFETDPILTWQEAREECRKLGGDLGWALGEDGEKMLRSLMTPFVEANGHSPVWVGGYRNSEWEWLDGTSISDDFWPEDYDKWQAPNSIAMVRWIGSYRSINPEATQPKGFLCMWE